MKIRTDFVTNSSSSSFISFRLDLARFEKLNANNNLSISLKEDDGYYFSFTTEDGEAKISSNVEGGIYTPTLPQLFMTLMLGNEAHATKEYQAVGDDWNAGYSPRDTTGLTHYSDYIVKNRPDGTNASVLKYVQELYENTDLFDKMVIDAEYSYGGGEADGSESQLGDFQTSGERTVTGYGKLKEYDAHPYLGGFGYEGQYESFIIYDSGTLELRDREMKYQEQSCIWDDERVESTILHLANTKRTFGLYRIERFSCNSVNKIILPVSCNTIEDEAFTECKNLKELHILRRNVVLGEDIAKKKVHIFSPAGGTAEQYAKEHGNPFTAVSLDSYGKCYTENERILTIGGHYQITLPEECDCFFHDDNKDSGILHGVNYKLSEGTVFNSGQLTDIKFGLRHDGEKPIQTAKELCEIYMDELSIAGDITELQATERFSAAILIGRVMSILGVNGDTAILVIKDHETDPLVLMIITATRDDSLINALGYRLYQLAREIRLLPDGVVMHWAAYPIING